MGAYILIAVMVASGNYSTVVLHDFHSKTACIAAMTSIQLAVERERIRHIECAPNFKKD